MKISLVIPSRNNLKYLTWMYSAIIKHKGDVDVEVCVADDASTDGTWEWCVNTMKADENFKAIQNPGPERIGLTLLYNKLVSEVATGDVIGIYHADMYLCPGALEEVQSLLKPKTVVSLTRIEPPLHPPGPEKVIADFAIEPEFFEENVFLSWFDRFILPQDKKPTEGIFAPWFLYKQDFLHANGHDRLFAPQTKEDSDIFNRLHLMGFTFKQTWKGYVYHMTSRGSRFNPLLTIPGVNSKEWEVQNKISERNFIRKWGNVPLHTRTMKPIVPLHHRTVLKLSNATLPAVKALEPWVSVLVVDNYDITVPEYIEAEQPKTLFNLSERIKHASFYSVEDAPVLIELDTLNLNEHTFSFIQQVLYHLPEVWNKGVQEGSPLPYKVTDEDELVRITVRKLEEKNCNYVFN